MTDPTSLTPPPETEPLPVTEQPLEERIPRGLMSTEAARFLHDQASKVPAGLAVVEIGVYTASTLLWMAHGAGPDGARCFGVDPWDLAHNPNHSPRRAHFTDPAVHTQAVENVAASGLDVTLIRGFSVDIARSWDGPMIGLLHIDGSHNEQAVKSDFAAWRKHLTSGATVVFDDYNRRKMGVKRAVDRLVRRGYIVDLRVVADRLAVTRAP